MSFFEMLASLLSGIASWLQTSAVWIQTAEGSAQVIGWLVLVTAAFFLAFTFATMSKITSEWAELHHLHGLSEFLSNNLLMKIVVWFLGLFWFIRRFNYWLGDRLAAHEERCKFRDVFYITPDTPQAQAAVDSILAERAEELDRYARGQEKLQQQTPKTTQAKSNWLDRMLSVTQDLRGEQERFYSAREVARQQGFDIRGSYKDYLKPPRQNKQLKANTAAA